MGLNGLNEPLLSLRSHYTAAIMRPSAAEPLHGSSFTDRQEDRHTDADGNLLVAWQTG